MIRPGVIGALEYTPDNAHNVILRALLLLRIHPILNTRAPHLRVDTFAAKSVLRLPHARVDIDILQPDEHGTVGGALEPAVDLPGKVQEDEQRASKVELEESGGVEVGTADWV